MTATASGSSSAAAVLKPVNPSIATTSTCVAPGLRALGEPGLERLLGAALDHVQQPGRAGAVADRGEVDDHGDVLVAAAGVAPHVLVHADRPRRRRTGARIVDQHPLALGQDRVVGGVPRDRRGLRRRGRRSGAGPRSPPAPTAARGATASPAARPPGWCPGATRARSRCTGSGGSSRPAASWVASPAARAPTAGSRCPAAILHSRTGDTTRSGSTTRHASTARSGSRRWPVDDQAELVEPAERGQVRAGEARRGSVKHVEVFRMGGVGTSILGRPRPLPGHRRADARYTLIGKSRKCPRPGARQGSAPARCWRQRGRTIPARDAGGASAILWAWSTCPECRDRRWTG